MLDVIQSLGMYMLDVIQSLVMYMLDVIQSLGMTNTEFFTVFAVLLSPLFALRVEFCLHKMFYKKNERKKIYSTLLRTRSNKVSNEYVEALQLILMYFKEKGVDEKYMQYIEHLNRRIELDRELLWRKAWTEHQRDFDELQKTTSKNTGSNREEEFDFIFKKMREDNNWSDFYVWLEPFQAGMKKFFLDACRKADKYVSESKSEYIWDFILGEVLGNTWQLVADDYSDELLCEIGRSVKQNITKEKLQKRFYMPQAHAEISSDENMIRKHTLRVLSGSSPLEVMFVPNNRDQSEAVYSKSNKIEAPSF